MNSCFWLSAECWKCKKEIRLCKFTKMEKGPCPFCKTELEWILMGQGATSHHCETAQALPSIHLRAKLCSTGKHVQCEDL